MATDCWARSQGIIVGCRNCLPGEEHYSGKPRGGHRGSVDTETVQGRSCVSTPPDRDQTMLPAFIRGKWIMKSVLAKAKGKVSRTHCSGAGLTDYPTCFGGWQKACFCLHYTQQECQMVKSSEDWWNPVA